MFRFNTGRENFRIDCGVQIPMRDGITLSGNLYIPGGQIAASPCILAMTPYGADGDHERASYFARAGFPYLIVDCRGRGNSGGDFRPYQDIGRDGFDTVEWLAQQPYCNGKVGMSGASYMAFAQWATAAARPPHLTTIVPTAAPYLGVDVPFPAGIPATYFVQWLSIVAGRTRQTNVFSDSQYWDDVFLAHFRRGSPFGALREFCSDRVEVFDAFADHADDPVYWETFNPSADDYAAIEIPILTITGAYDGDQAGALAHYRAHTTSVDTPHYLILGPWDHAGTHTPKDSFRGIKTGKAACLDMKALHLEWFRWTMCEGARPDFLEAPVAYYLAQSDRWERAQSLVSAARAARDLYLQADGNPVSVFQAGTLTGERCEPLKGFYVYNPLDPAPAELEISTEVAGDLDDQRALQLLDGRHFIFHTAPLDADLDLVGFPRLSIWLSLDQPDTDFRVNLFEIGSNGQSLLLSSCDMRARYREGLGLARRVERGESHLYDFRDFNFVARTIRQGSRIRLQIGPICSTGYQRNFNSGKPFGEECATDARSVTVRLDGTVGRPCVLRLPIAQAAPDVGKQADTCYVKKIQQ